jgi:membrane-associated phospholipid phosphatase
MLVWASGKRISCGMIPRIMGILRRPIVRTLVVAVVLGLVVPLYYVIAWTTEPSPQHAPAIALDGWIPLQPGWMVVYGSIWVFMLLPFAVVREDGLIIRMLLAYLTVVSVSYAGFLAWPTLAPRPAEVPAGGFLAWALRFNYAFDPPRNCFPSLHVAWAFVTAFACHRVHRGVGRFATGWAALIGISTLFTKQHYVVDVIAGVLLAVIAERLFLRGHPAAAIPEDDRRRAPFRAMWVVAAYGLFAAGFWMAYLG